VLCERAAGAIGGNDLGLLRRRRRDVLDESTNESSESNCSALLWRRSNPIVEAGFADSPRPQTEPE